jgi:hypothetical protein
MRRSSSDEGTSEERTEEKGRDFNNQRQNGQAQTARTKKGRLEREFQAAFKRDLFVQFASAGAIYPVAQCAGISCGSVCRSFIRQ